MKHKQHFKQMNPYTETQQMTQSPESTYQKSKTNKIGISFIITAFFDQVLVCLMYGLLYDFNPDVRSSQEFDDLLLVSIMTILVIVGFGLHNAYITNSSFSGMALSLLIFALTIEHYFLIKTFWEKAGASHPDSKKTWNNAEVEKISLVNVGQDRFVDFNITHFSFVDAIACALSNIIVFSSLVGRIQLMEVYYLSIVGTFLYELNNAFIWRWEITDTGYGMRIFLFAGIMGLVSACIIGKRKLKLTHNHSRYFSIYSTRALGLVGLVIIVSTFPILCVGSLYRTSENHGYVMYAAALRMWLAVIAGVLGAFSASSIAYKKIFIYDIIYGGINGGICYSVSCDLVENPAAPLGIGFIGAFITSLFLSRQIRNTNKEGVIFSIVAWGSYVLPGLFAGLMGAVLHSIGQGYDGNFSRLTGTNPNGTTRSFIQQGLWQIVGIATSIAFALFAGVLLGLMMMCFERSVTHPGQELTDEEIFSGKKKGN